jgi:hypothetical protein
MLRRYPDSILVRLGRQQAEILNSWFNNNRFLVWANEPTTAQEYELGARADTAKMLEFGAVGSGSGCCKVCGTMLLIVSEELNEVKLCSEHSGGHCPDCGLQLGAGAPRCRGCGYSDMQSISVDALIAAAGGPQPKPVTRGTARQRLVWTLPRRGGYQAQEVQDGNWDRTATTQHAPGRRGEPPQQY